MAIHYDMSEAQFENANSLRLYPFAEGSSLLDRDGKELSRDAIVDVHLVVPSSLDGESDVISGLGSLPRVTLVSMHMSSHMVSACFRAGTTALSVTVASENFRPYMPYRLEKLVGSEDIGGVVTFGDVVLPGFPETYLFRDRFDGDIGIEIHQCCVAVAKPPSLRSFIDERSGDRVSGDVEIGFSGYVRSERNRKSFLLSLEEGADIELASECLRENGIDVCGATPIATINGVRPDEQGNIVLWFH